MCLQLRQCAGNRAADGADGRLQIIKRTVGRCDDLFPIPLIDINRMQVIHFLVAADGIHIRIQSLARLKTVFIERHPFPFGE